MLTTRKEENIDETIKRVLSELPETKPVVDFKTKKSASDTVITGRKNKSVGVKFEWTGTIRYEQHRKNLSSSSIIAQDSCIIDKDGKKFKIIDLIKLTKPAKCSRKSYLNEPLQAAIPYPVSLLSLPLDDNDKKLISKKIKANSKSKDKSQITYNSYMKQNVFHVGTKISQVMYFTVSRLNLTKHSNPLKDEAT